MRKLIAAALAAAAMLAFLTPAFAERARSRISQATQPQSGRSYEQCHSLALQRGLTVTRKDRWQLDEFIAGCLSGQIR
jgi:hypothetical protein